MVRGLLTRLFGRSDTSDGESDDEDDQDGGSRFLPSRLDASVLFAHGMGSRQAERELASVEEKARVLEDEQRNE